MEKWAFIFMPYRMYYLHYLQFRLLILFMLSPILETLAALWVVLLIHNTIQLNTISL